MSIVTRATCPARKIAACPAELPAPTIATCAPRHIWASIGVAA